MHSPALSAPHLRPSRPGGRRPRSHTRGAGRWLSASPERSQVLHHLRQVRLPGPAARALHSRGIPPGPSPRYAGPAAGSCGTAGRGTLGAPGHKADAARLGTARQGSARFISPGSCRVPSAAVPPCGAAGKLRRPPRRSPLSPAAAPAPLRGQAEAAPGRSGPGTRAAVSASGAAGFFFSVFYFPGGYGADCPEN